MAWSAGCLSRSLLCPFIQVTLIIRARTSNFGRPTGRLRDDKGLSAGRLFGANPGELSEGGSEESTPGKEKATKREAMSKFQPQACGQTSPEGLCEIT